MSQINVDTIVSQSAGPVTINDDLIVTGTNNIRPYKVYSALISQTGTNPPVADVLENTMNGFIGFNYLSVGTYSITSNNEFTLNKTAIFVNSTLLNEETIGCVYGGTSFCQIATRDSFGVSANGVISFYKTFIEVRVYP
jgi:hypothetical protein